MPSLLSFRTIPKPPGPSPKSNESIARPNHRCQALFAFARRPAGGLRNLAKAGARNAAAHLLESSDEMRLDDPNQLTALGLSASANRALRRAHESPPRNKSGPF